MKPPKKKRKGEPVILDNNPLSIACFLEEYGDDILDEDSKK